MDKNNTKQTKNIQNCIHLGNKKLKPPQSENSQASSAFTISSVVRNSPTSQT